MIKQIITCLIIYSIFYTIINNDYVFSKDFTDKAKEILSQDININEWYSMFLNSIQNITNENQEENSTNIENDVENNVEEDASTEVIEENKENTEIKELSQMEQDVNYIKSTISFIKPVNGIISSKYGLRNSTIKTVSKDHNGTDIAADKGTKIVSATNGTVMSALSKGDYGKHLKIQIDDVVIVYAHCNELYVNDGDIVTQGQEIAEVGSTGKTTGPHLHFEIRYQERTVDPQMILEL